ncbi:MAG TPA: Zn-dependent alcohol dehydrogenase [Anaerolineales bacterium]|nr:Zn-dependent alcohol dehydrogenase [Anaerolineales bacterium]
MHIKAALFHAPSRPFEIRALQLERPRAGEVLVEMGAAGVCHSDWHLMTGATRHPVPVVPGHEGAGVVSAVGAGVERIKTGDRVALNWAPSCGECFYCSRGRPSLCRTYIEPIWGGTMLDGTTRLSLDGRPVYHFSALACFAERIVVPEVCCVPVPPEVPVEVAALIGCAVTTGVGAVQNTAKVEPGSTVAVIGAGGVGLSVVLGARLAGADRIIAVDIHESKGDLALELGATDFVVNGPEATGEIRRLTGGRGADYVFEAVGLPALQEQALEAARPGGTIVLVGISPMGSATNLPGAVLTREEKTVMGSYYGTADPAHEFPRLAALYLNSRLDLDRLVTKRYRLEQINEAYADMVAGEGARGVVVFPNA